RSARPSPPAGRSPWRACWPSARRSARVRLLKLQRPGEGERAGTGQVGGAVDEPVERRRDAENGHERGGARGAVRERAGGASLLPDLGRERVPEGAVVRLLARREWRRTVCVRQAWNRGRPLKEPGLLRVAAVAAEHALLRAGRGGLHRHRAGGEPEGDRQVPEP